MQPSHDTKAGQPKSSQGTTDTFSGASRGARLPRSITTQSFDEALQFLAPRGGPGCYTPKTGAAHVGAVARATSDADGKDGPPLQRQDAGGTGGTSGPGERFVVAGNGVRVRSEPSTDAEVLGKLDRGDEVEGSGERVAPWIGIAHDGGAGWVHGDYVRSVDAPSGAEEPVATTIGAEEQAATSPDAEPAEATTGETVGTAGGGRTTTLNEVPKILKEKEERTAINYNRGEHRWNEKGATRAHRLNPAWVAELQARLGAPTEQPGAFDGPTVQLIAQHQQGSGLGADGCIDEATFAALAQVMAGADVSPDPRALDASEVKAGDDDVARGKTFEEYLADNDTDEVHGTLRAIGTTFEAWFGAMKTMKFLSRDVTAHPLLLERLQLALDYLMLRAKTDEKREDLEDELEDIPVGRSISTGSNARGLHGMGLAIDIDGKHNDYVLGSTNEAKNERSIQTFARAIYLTGSSAAVPTRKTLAKLAKETTAKAWEAIDSLNGIVKAYFALEGDLGALEEQISMLAGRSPPEMPDGVAFVSPEATAAAWSAQIADDRGDEKSNDDRQLEAGSMMNLDKELVISMRDAGGLSWGATDIEGSEGDTMHFDLRSDERVGYPVYEARKVHKKASDEATPAKRAKKILKGLEGKGFEAGYLDELRGVADGGGE